MSTIAERIVDFLKPATPDPAPALSEWREFQVVENAAHSERTRLGQRIAGCAATVTKSAQLEEQIRQLRDAMDLERSDCAYANLPAPALTTEREKLAKLERELNDSAEAVRAAKLLLPRLQSDSAALAAKIDGMKGEKNRLLHARLTEIVDGYAEQYLADIERLCSTAHKVYAAATAADSLRLSPGLGIAPLVSSGDFFASENYWQISRIPRPLRPAFYPSKLTPEQTEAARLADCKAVRDEADELIHRLLSGADV